MAASDEKDWSMKVLWLVNGMMPEMAVALGLRGANTGGWMPSLISALHTYSPEIELSFICEWRRDAEVEVEGRRHFALRQMNGPLLLQGRSSREEFGKKIKSIIERVKPDLVHFHGTENGYLDFPDEVWSGVPRLVSLQGVINGIHPHYLGGLTPRQLRPHRNWIRYLATGHDLFDIADSWRERVAKGEAVSLARVRHIAGRTEWDRAWAEALAPHATYYRLGEIMRPEFYGQGAPTNVRDPHRIFASAAFKYPLKGGHTLLEALSILKRDFPDVKLAIADSLAKIAPSGLLGWARTTEYHGFLRKLIKGLGLTDNIELLPSLNASRVVEELRKAAVYCQASFVENSPNSLAEAQLVGTPVVATYVGGIPSMVNDGENGALIPAGDPASMARAISNFFRNPESAASMSSRARVIAFQRHDAKIIAQNVLDCYRSVIRNG